MTDEEKELLARIEAAREKRAAVQERMGQAARKSALKAEAEAEERHLVEAEKLEELVEQHGPLGKALRVLSTPEGHMVVIKAPGYLLFKKFQSAGFDKVNAQEDIVRACLVHPSQAEFMALREKYPALTAQAANEITALATVKNEELPGK